MIPTKVTLSSPPVRLTDTEDVTDAYDAKAVGDVPFQEKQQPPQTQQNSQQQHKSQPQQPQTQQDQYGEDIVYGYTSKRPPTPPIPKQPIPSWKLARLQKQKENSAAPSKTINPNSMRSPHAKCGRPATEGNNAYREEQQQQQQQQQQYLYQDDHRQSQQPEKTDVKYQYQHQQQAPLKKHTGYMEEQYNTHAQLGQTSQERDQLLEENTHLKHYIYQLQCHLQQVEYMWQHHYAQFAGSSGSRKNQQRQQQQPQPQQRQRHSWGTPSATYRHLHQQQQSRQSYPYSPYQRQNNFNSSALPMPAVSMGMPPNAGFPTMFDPMLPLDQPDMARCLAPEKGHSQEDRSQRYRPRRQRSKSLPRKMSAPDDMDDTTTPAGGNDDDVYFAFPEAPLMFPPMMTKLPLPFVPPSFPQLFGRIPSLPPRFPVTRRFDHAYNYRPVNELAQDDSESDVDDNLRTSRGDHGSANVVDEDNPRVGDNGDIDNDDDDDDDGIDVDDDDDADTNGFSDMDPRSHIGKYQRERHGHRRRRQYGPRPDESSMHLFPYSHPFYSASYPPYYQQQQQEYHHLSYQQPMQDRLVGLPPSVVPVPFRHQHRPHRDRHYHDYYQDRGVDGRSAMMDRVNSNASRLSKQGGYIYDEDMRNGVNFHLQQRPDHFTKDRRPLQKQQPSFYGSHQP